MHKLQEEMARKLQEEMARITHVSDIIVRCCLRGNYCFGNPECSRL